MGFTEIHTDLMYSALDYFIEHDKAVRIFRDNLGISFETELGNHGLVIPNLSGDWDVFLEDQKVYEIEKEVYSVITHRENSIPIEDYIKKLREVLNLRIKDKSRSFVETTISAIEIMVIHGRISLKNDFKFGPLFIYYDRILAEKKIIILN
jgi:hypothetical protein